MFGEGISKTKCNIYKAAASLFAQNGYNETSMEEIAKMVGIKKGTIYSHFESKKEILQGLYDAFAKQNTSMFPI